MSLFYGNYITPQAANNWYQAKTYSKKTVFQAVHAVNQGEERVKVHDIGYHVLFHTFTAASSLSDLRKKPS